ncbi:hypothetical protein BH11MYX1_BH11MYX1_42900 [soil metagenome]
MNVKVLRAIFVEVVLIAVAWLAPLARHRWIQHVIHDDAPPSDPLGLVAATHSSLPPVARVRVVLIDGLSASVAAKQVHLQAACSRGLDLIVDVGFPTVSLPVESALWSGLTQQQSGYMFRSDTPLVPPLVGIPSQVTDSIAIAEDHGWIVRSLGFAHTEPAADPGDLAKDAAPDEWRGQWLAHARAAIASEAKLVFVHILRVDTAGHRTGRDSPLYWIAAGTADSMLDGLMAQAPDARWFLLSDHGHLARGGHGGDEVELRQVEGCIVGPGLTAKKGGPVHIVDIARAIADSLGVVLAPAAHGRALAEAMAYPLRGAQAVPAVPLGHGAFAWLMIAIGALSAYVAGRAWLAPWWFVIACISLLAIGGEPTLSAPEMWAPTGRAMYLIWLPALAVLGAVTWIGLGRTSLGRVVIAQLGLPFAAVAAAISASGAWPLLLGRDLAPVVPHFTAWLSPLILMAAQGAAVVALVVLARSARSVFGRRGPPETPRTDSAAE